MGRLGEEVAPETRWLAEKSARESQFAKTGSKIAEERHKAKEEEACPRKMANHHRAHHRDPEERSISAAIQLGRRSVVEDRNKQGRRT